MRRRSFLKQLGYAAAAATIPSCSVNQTKPNIIICIADDLGWGDTGYSGHPILKTPNLDEMCRSGLRFNRFYAAAPVCSPTRGSCLTGRHPFRYGIFSANVGHLPKEEVTLAEVLRSQGYSTGHFGKWHLGTLSKTVHDSNRGGVRGRQHYSPPWENGFDVCFSTEAKVPTFDPMKKPVGWSDRRWWNALNADQPFEAYNTRYWTGPDQSVTGKLEGDDSKVIMDQALDFIKDSSRENRHFLSVIWFHAPHWPVVAGAEDKRYYSELDEFSQNHFGSITAMDGQIGRLRKRLKQLDLSRNTLLFFCSDNGPEGIVAAGGNHGAGSAGLLRGRKRSLFEGGIRVPGLLEWPTVIRTGRVTNVPCCTSDYFPTVLQVLGIRDLGSPQPLDGINLLPIINGSVKLRSSPIAFESGKQQALIDDRYKIISQDRGETFALFDILSDPEERNNLAKEKPDLLQAMMVHLDKWRVSCVSSREGNDYHSLQ